MSISERTERNYQVLGNIGKLYLDEQTADVTFLFDHENGTQTIAAHKCILATASSVFRQMFYGDLKEGNEVRIVDVTRDAFVAFLQFFYLEHITFSGSIIGEVMKLADKYDVTGCMELCTRYLTLIMSTENVCWCYELALLFDLAHLISSCEQKICMETQKVLESNSFLQCSRHVLGHILLMDSLTCDEIHVFHAAMLWAMEACRRAGIDETNAENIKQQLGNCFDLIRFPTMSPEDFYSCIADKENLLTNNEIMDILSYLTMHRPLQVATRFEQTARKGPPVWTKDGSIQICDRRTLPNLCRETDLKQDLTVFSVNERILLGQIAISKFKALPDESNEEQTRTGHLIFRKILNENTADDDENKEGESPKDIETDVILEQDVIISSASTTKIELKKPILLQPFQLYEIESNWELNDGEGLIIRTECNEEIILDGGVLFKFKRKPELAYDNNIETLVSRLYFKQW